MTGTATLNRETFKMSRLMDFCSSEELVKQTGHDQDDWPLVVLKELVDNSLDACEEAGIAPVIDVVADGEGVTVSDNGPGIPGDTIKGVLDFSVRVSSREAYVSPTRGQQGNALMTVIAIPFALDGAMGAVEIHSRGVHHRIVMRVDRIAQKPVLDHQTGPSDIKTGTKVLVRWPDSASRILDDADAGFLHAIMAYSAINPHLTIRVDWFGSTGTDTASNPGWNKWRPDNPTSAHWYEPGRFENLVAQYIGLDRTRNDDRTVRSFIKEFDGLSSQVKQKTITEAVGLTGARLSALRNGAGLRAELTRDLLVAMQGESKIVKSTRLGAIGQDHLRQCFGSTCDLDAFRYRKIQDVTDGVPWVVEAAFAPMEEVVDDDGDPVAIPRNLLTGVNWSAALVNPFRKLHYQSLDSTLTEQRCGRSEPIMLAIHVACARVSYLDRGKSSVVLPGECADAVEDVVKAVTEKWAKMRKSEERSARTQSRKDALAERPERKLNKKEATARVIEKAYHVLSEDGKFPVNGRQLYYECRGEILELTGKENLSGDYFSQTLLVDFMENNPELTAEWVIDRDPRGKMIEPHTGDELVLGSKAVREYVKALRPGSKPGEFFASASVSCLVPKPGYGGDPSRQFGAVLFIEKEGFHGLFESVRLQQRFDIALMSTKGHTVVAARKLVDEVCGKFGLTLFVLHDFDKSGLEITHALRHDTRRYKYKHKVRVVDLGVTLDDIHGHDLPSEYVPYNTDPRPGLRKIGATEDEIEFLYEGAWRGSELVHHGKRVELNAFRPRAFVEWVESRLIASGVKKVVPDQDVLAEAYRSKICELRFYDGAEALNKHAKRVAADAKAYAENVAVPDDLVDQVRGRLEVGSSITWKHTIDHIAVAVA